MKRAIILQHLDRESPGLLLELCAERDLVLEIVHLDRDVGPPSSVAVGDLLVVMGGSMGVGDLADPRYPFLAAEVQLLKRVLANQQPVLGICLGAQLLAHAAGARVYRNMRPNPDGVLQPAPEVGFGEVERVDDGKDPIFSGLGSTLPVLHWHGDTFDLPPGATHLAKSQACLHQAFRIDRHAIGLQFHPEVTEDMVRTWATEDADFAISALGSDGPNRIMAGCTRACAALMPSGRRLLGNVLDQLLS